jgi:hypothetical protein
MLFYIGSMPNVLFARSWKNKLVACFKTVPKHARTLAIMAIWMIVFLSFGIRFMTQVNRRSADGSPAGVLISALSIIVEGLCSAGKSMLSYFSEKLSHPASNVTKSINREEKNHQMLYSRHNNLSSTSFSNISFSTNKKAQMHYSPTGSRETINSSFQKQSRTESSKGSQKAAPKTGASHTKTAKLYTTRSVENLIQEITESLTTTESLTQKPISNHSHQIEVASGKGAIRITWNELDVQVKLAAIFIECSKPYKLAMPIARVDALRAYSFTYTLDDNLGENAHVSVHCDELTYKILFSQVPPMPDSGPDKMASTTLWIRLCPQIGAVGMRISGQISSPLGECRGQLRLSAQLRNIMAGELNWTRSMLWAVASPQHLYTRCSLAQLAEQRDCFGKYDVLFSPTVIEAFANGSSAGGANGYRVLSLASAQGWRSPGLRLTPLRDTAQPPPAVSLEASVDFADLDGTQPGAPPPPPPLPTLAARGVVTSPFLVVSAARSFAAMRNSAEALNRAFNSVCTLNMPAAAAGNSNSQAPPVFVTAASLHMPHTVPARDLAGGKALRVMRYSDETEVELCAKEANRTGFHYILIDAGWYGPELDYDSDPTTPAALAYAARVCAAAARHGVEVFLYINRRHLEQHMPRLAGALRAAGAAGLKFGFVNYTATRDVEAVVGWAHACLREGLLVNTHDDLVPSGLHLLLPNMLSFEAVRGNEAFPSPIHTVRVGLVRGLAGPADYTPVVHSPKLVLPLVHVLVLPLLLYNPLQHLYFYSLSIHVKSAPTPFRRVWSATPTTWARTVWLSGHPDTHTAVARQAADGSLYLGVVCGAPNCGAMDLWAHVRTLARCERPVTVEAYLDVGEEGNRSIESVPIERLVDVCDEKQGRAQLGHVKLSEGQAALVWLRPE